MELDFYRNRDHLLSDGSCCDNNCNKDCATLLRFCLQRLPADPLDYGESCQFQFNIDNDDLDLMFGSMLNASTINPFSYVNLEVILQSSKTIYLLCLFVCLLVY